MLIPTPINEDEEVIPEKKIGKGMTIPKVIPERENGMTIPPAIPEQESAYDSELNQSTLDKIIAVANAGITLPAASMAWARDHLKGDTNISYKDAIADAFWNKKQTPYSNLNLIDISAMGFVGASTEEYQKYVGEFRKRNPVSGFISKLGGDIVSTPVAMLADATIAKGSLRAVKGAIKGAKVSGKAPYALIKAESWGDAVRNIATRKDNLTAMMAKREAFNSLAKDVKDIETIRASITVDSPAEYATSVNKLLPKIREYYNKSITELDLRTKALANLKDTKTLSKADSASIDALISDAKKELQRVDDVSKTLDKTFSTIEKTSYEKTLSKIRETDVAFAHARNGLKYLDDIDSKLTDALEKVTRLQDIDNLVYKSKAKIGEEAFEAQKEQMLVRKNYLNEWAKFNTYGKIEKYHDLPLPLVRKLHDDVKMVTNLKSMDWLSDATKWATPERKVFERAGVRPIFENINDALWSGLWRASKEIDDVVSASNKAYFKRFGKKWNEESDVLFWEYADKGFAPAELEAKFTADERLFIMNRVNELHKFTDKAADLAELQGKLTSDPRIAEELGIPLRQPNYMRHVRENLTWAVYKEKEFIENFNNWARGNKVSEVWKEELESIFGKGYTIKSRTGQPIPAKFNTSEFMKRIKDDDDFVKTNATAVLVNAYKHEMRDLLLNPVIEQAKATISLIPDEQIRTLIGTQYARLAKVARGMTVKGDETLNAWFGSNAMRKVISKLPYFKKYSNEQRLWEAFVSSWSRRAMRGIMLGNTVQMAKNALQMLHTSPLIGSKETFEGIRSMFTRGGRELLGYSGSMWGRIPLEQFDPALGQFHNVEKLQQIFRNLDSLGYAPSAFVERYWNCASANNGAIHYILSRAEGKVYRDKLAEYAIEHDIPLRKLKGLGIWDVLADARKDPIYSEYFKPLTDAGDYANSVAQFVYQRHAMPSYLHSASGRFLGTFTSWTANYATNYIPQLITMLKTGKDMYGYPIGWSQRMAIFKHLTMVGGIFYIGSKMGFDMLWITPYGTAPTGKILGREVTAPVAPLPQTIFDMFASAAELANPRSETNIGQLLWDLGKLTTGSMDFEDLKVGEFTKKFWTYDLPSLVVPAWLETKRIGKVVTGEKPVKSLAYPVPPKEKSKGTSRYRSDLR